MVGSSKSNRMRQSKNCRTAQSLKKMFLNQEIHPDHYSGEGIYKFRDLFQHFEFNIFTNLLREIAKVIESAGGIYNWGGEGR